MPNDTVSLDLAREALGYASKGIKIFPLWHAVGGVCQCRDGADCGSPAKHPRNPHGVRGASRDLELVARSWQTWPHAGIGLPAEDNGLAILDVDTYHGGQETLDKLDAWCLARNVNLMATRAVRTGTGGLHLYFLQPPGGIKTARETFGAPGIDTRGRGGYVVAPPSVHANGQRYEIIDGRPPARWPVILDRLMRPTHAAPQVITPERRAQLSRQGSNGAAARWAAAALESECEQLRNLPAGEGNGKNAALNAAAYKMGRRVGASYLDERYAVEELYRAASGWQGHGPRELLATIRSGIDAGKANPHPGPTTRRADGAR